MFAAADEVQDLRKGFRNVKEKESDEEKSSMFGADSYADSRICSDFCGSHGCQYLSGVKFGRDLSFFG
jgi:hypothetical protein